MGISIVFFILSLLCFAYDASATDNGIIGFGLSFYPDLCCQSCHDSLSTLYLDCTTFSDGGDGMAMDGMDGMDMSIMQIKEMDMGTEAMGTTSDECRATNTPWLQTMAYCIQQNCDVDGYPAKKQAECFTNQALAGAPGPTFQDSLPATAPTDELMADAMWLNVTSLVNRDVYYSTHGTIGELKRSEYIHTRYSLILYLIVVGVMLACGAVAHMRSRFPAFNKQLQTSAIWTKLQQSVFLPALFGFRRMQPLRKIGYMPGRMLSIFIAIYVILNIVFSSISFRSFQPNIYFFSKGYELCEYVGNRTGTLSLVNMSMAILFAGRNNVLISITGWSQSTFLALHRWAARVATVQAVVHSIVYTMGSWQPGYSGAADYATQAAKPFYWWGIIATIAMSLAVAFAILPLRMSSYEIFLALHIALVILTLVGCWYHLIPHFGFIYGYQVWLYICFAFWAGDRLARLGRVLYFNRFGTSRAIVQTTMDPNIIELTVFLKTSWNFKPGQHSFLYVPGLVNFWESHPFSITAWKTSGQTLATASHSRARTLPDASTKESDVPVVAEDASAEGSLPPNQASIRFLLRVHSEMTAKIHRHLRSSSSPLPMEISVCTEGPYGGHAASHPSLVLADTVLCIVGGIGITHILGFIHEYANTNLKGGQDGLNTKSVMRKAKRFIVAWTARESGLIEHVKHNYLPDVDGIEYSFWCTAPGSSAVKEGSGPQDSEGTTTTGFRKTGKMDIGTVIKSSLETGLQTTVLVCGPGSMADEATRQVVNCVKAGHRVDVVEEAYAW